MLLAVSALLAFAGSSCGGGASSSAPNTQDTPEAGNSDSAAVAGSLQSFGVRANVTQERAAAAALVSYLRARVERKWPIACSYISLSARRLLLKAVDQLPRHENGSCPKALAVFLSVPPPSQRDDFLTVDPVALKLKGSTAVLVYHGGEGEDYAIQMIAEDGGWKVGGLAPVPLS